MKIRNGFVSNSSSSSFLILSKKGEELDKAKLKRIFALPENHPLSGIEKDIMQCIYSNMEQQSYGQFIQEHCYGIENKTEMELLEELQEYTNLDSETLLKVKSGEYLLYSGSFDSCGDGIESFLCENEMHIDNEDFKMIHDGGY